MHSSRLLDFSEMQPLSSSVEYLEMQHCSISSLNTLLNFLPHLRYLGATVMMVSPSRELEAGKWCVMHPLLNSIKLKLINQSSDVLTHFLGRFQNLRKLQIIARSVIDDSMNGSSWFAFITKSLPALIKFKLESSVALWNIDEHLQSFAWPNRRCLQEKTALKESNYSCIKVVVTK